MERKIYYFYLFLIVQLQNITATNNEERDSQIYKDLAKIENKTEELEIREIDSDPLQSNESMERDKRGSMFRITRKEEYRDALQPAKFHHKVVYVPLQTYPIPRKTITQKLKIDPKEKQKQKYSKGKNKANLQKLISEYEINDCDFFNNDEKQESESQNHKQTNKAKDVIIVGNQLYKSIQTPLKDIRYRKSKKDGIHLSLHENPDYEISKEQHVPYELSGDDYEEFPDNFRKLPELREYGNTPLHKYLKSPKIHYQRKLKPVTEPYFSGDSFGEDVGVIFGDFEKSLFLPLEGLASNDRRIKRKVIEDVEKRDKKKQKSKRRKQEVVDVILIAKETENSTTDIPFLHEVTTVSFYYENNHTDSKTDNDKPITLRERNTKEQLKTMESSKIKPGTVAPRESSRSNIQSDKRRSRAEMDKTTIESGSLRHGIRNRGKIKYQDVVNRKRFSGMQ